MSSTSSLVPPAQATFGYWKLLPRELRLLILSKTHLVRRHDWTWNESASAAGPTILDGRLMIPVLVPDGNVCDHEDPGLRSDQCSRCLAGREISFPIALFTVSKQMYEDASEVFWSQRFVLRGTFGNTAVWLSTLGEERASRIRKMDLLVEGCQVLRVASHILWCQDYEDDEGDEDLLTEYDLQILIDTIWRKCNLGKLWLSFDVEWSDTISHVWEESSYTRGKSLRENLQRTYELLFKPLVQNFQGG
ncbi:MAG: hypothetical protein OHK93_000792 [Ramalina farinacea]|uniref:Uncharacterized protein n=1 Tax=Ramalina farinacea TaxID=258253 RepID=A0AA43QNA5_9LECA|nr:hypothetical protein [Ramalina farinacea]